MGTSERVCEKRSPQEVANYIVENNLEDELMNEDWWKRKSDAVSNTPTSIFGPRNWSVIIHE